MRIRQCLFRLTLGYRCKGIAQVFLPLTLLIAIATWGSWVKGAMDHNNDAGQAVQPNDAASPYPIMKWQELYEAATLLFKLPQWHRDRDISDAEMNRLKRAAAALQGFHPSDAETVFCLLMTMIEQSKERNRADARSTSFLLLRMMFVLPDNVDAFADRETKSMLFHKHGVLRFGGEFAYADCSTMPDERPLVGSFSFPVDASGDTLRVTCWLAFPNRGGGRGLRYQPQLEYRYFQSHFEMRPNLVPPNQLSEGWRGLLK